MAYDTSWSNVVLLMHMDGPNGNTLFLDGSPTPKAITTVGNAQHSTTTSKFGPSSALFDGSGDWLSTTSSLNDFAFRTGDFTVECFVYINSLTTSKVIIDSGWGASNNSWQLEVITTGYVQWWGNALIFTSTATVSTGQWVYIAVTRVSGVLSIFINNSLAGTTADATDYSGTGSTMFTIGAQVQNRNASYDMNGYIDEVRITKGVGRYSGTITTPTAQFLSTGNYDPFWWFTSLLLNGNGTNGSTTFTDSSYITKTISVFGNAQISTAQLEFGNASMLFDGNGDYLSAPAHTDFNFASSNDFTIEAWIYPNTTFTSPSLRWNTNASLTARGTVGTLQVNGSVDDNYIQLTPGSGFSFQFMGTTYTDLYVGSNSYITFGGGSTVHTVINGNALALPGLVISAADNSYQRVYSEFTDVSNTVYWIRFEGTTAISGIVGSPTLVWEAWIHKNTSQIDLYVISNPSSTGSSGVTNSSSVLFNMNIPVIAGTKITIYTDNVVAQEIINKDGVAGTSYPQYALRLGSDGRLQGFLGNGNGANVGAQGLSYFGSTVLTNTWHHIAMSRVGTTCIGFLDGRIEWSESITPIALTEGSKSLLVGYQASGTLASYFNGYIDDLRLTKGSGLGARYTIPFSVPSAEAYAGGLVILGNLALSKTLLALSSPVGNTHKLIKGAVLTQIQASNYAGTYKIAGITIADSTPYAAHVMLFPKNAPTLCIRSTKTDSITGSFSFTGIAAGNYLIVAIDISETYRRINYSSIAAVPM